MNSEQKAASQEVKYTIIRITFLAMDEQTSQNILVRAKIVPTKNYQKLNKRKTKTNHWKRYNNQKLY